MAAVAGGLRNSFGDSLVNANRRLKQLHTDLPAVMWSIYLGTAGGLMALTIPRFNHWRDPHYYDRDVKLVKENGYVKFWSSCPVKTSVPPRQPFKDEA